MALYCIALSAQFPRKYQVPTHLDLFPLMTSAVSLIYKQSNALLNFGSTAAQVAPPLLRLLTFNLLVHPNSVSYA
jgi:hypothetical protein